jgi:hypothetical protein
MGMTMMFLLAKVALLAVLDLYLAVNVFDPAVRPVARYVALAWIPPVPLLLPCSRTRAVVSLAATTVLPETAKLM